MRVKVNSWRVIYLYLVSFVTLMMVIFAAVNIAHRAVSLAFGPVDYSPGPLELKARYADQVRQGEEVTEELILQQAKFEAERSRRSRMQADLRGLAQNVALLLVAFPIYLSHWKRARESDRDADDAESRST